MAIPSKKEQRLTRCGPAEGVSTASSRGRPKSKSLSAMPSAVVGQASRVTPTVVLRGVQRGPWLWAAGRLKPHVPAHWSEKSRII